MTGLKRWHLEAIRPAPAEPDPVTARQWQMMTETEHSRHVGALRQWLGYRHVPTAATASAAQALDRVVADNHDHTMPGAKRIFALSGPNTVGKSTMVNRGARQRYRDWIGPQAAARSDVPAIHPAPGVTANHVPVVRINLHSGAKIKEFDSQVLSFLGYPTDGVIRSMTDRLVKAAGIHQVRVLIVDDVHLLKTNWKGGRDVLDHLKHINTELGEQHACLVLVGADLDGSDIVADPQIAGRLELHEITPCLVDTAPEQADWLDILTAIEEPLVRHLPNARPGVLPRRAAGMIWLRTQGYLGDVTALLYGAAQLALTDGSLRITRRHLDAVTLTRRATRAQALLEQQRPTARRPTGDPVRAAADGVAV